jgi:hypothetical protein
MAITKPTIQWVASPNFTKGRGKPIRAITFHHIVGSDDSAISTFKNATNQKSATYVVGDTKITQMVLEADTPWTNSNFASNSECITIEHEGDWRNGYRNEAVINNSVKLVAWLRSRYPGIVFNRHREVSLKGTVCPADFPVEEVWNKATVLLNPPAPVVVVPPATAIQITDISNRIVITNKDANLWDLNFNTWAEARSVKVIPKGTEVEISAIAKHPLGSSYYMTEYSFSKGIKNGINVVDCAEKTVVVPPVVVPPPVVPPVEPEPDRNAIIAFLTAIRDMITAFLGKFKK